MGQPEGESSLQILDRLTNRHIAKLLSRINGVVELPELVISAIKSEFHWLKEDIALALGLEDGEGEEEG